MSRITLETEGDIVTKVSRTTAGLAVAAAFAIALSGCGGPSGGSAGDPADDVTYTIDDLTGLIEEGDGLTTLDFDPSEITGTAADDSTTMTGYWEQSEGEPQECFPIFGTSYLLAGTEDAAGGDDPTMELAAYHETGDDALGLVIVNGRVFDDTAAAAEFLASIEEFASACGGYTLTDGAGEVQWAVNGFELGTFSGAPEGVATVTNQEQVEGDRSPEQRTTFLQRGNAVISFFAETYEGGTFSVDDVDEVVGAVADRFAAVS
jgi:hypothetical protein